MSWRSFTRIFLDTAPLVYFVERNQTFFSAVEPIFDALDSGVLEAVTFPITLAECLVMPIRQAQAGLMKDFAELIVNGLGVSCSPITAAIGERAARLRAQYNLQLLDALQISTAIESACDAFLTNDHMLQRVTEVPILLASEL